MTEVQHSTDREARFRAIGEYYENRAVKCWEITSRGHLHSGYWDDANAADDPSAGPRRLTEMMISWTEVGKGDRFIDFGSGLGWPAIELAKAKGCTIDGVNASTYQTESARKAAEREGLAERVRFHLRDAVDTQFDDDTFDGGWFFESIFHMDHREALREARRVLKPGALLLITDFVNLEHTSSEFLELQEEVLFAHHAIADEYPGLLDDAGFDLIDLSDLTEQTILRAARKNREALELHRDEMLTAVEEIDEEYLEFVWEVSEAFAKNAGYIVIKARSRE